MKVTRQLTVVLALVVFCCAASADMHDGMMHYASLMSSDGSFELKWAYKDSGMFYFIMKCKNTGWCGVGFSSMGNGAGMKDYDIAAGGYSTSEYLYDYWSVGQRTPEKDAQKDLTIECASEMGGYTMVHFKRPANTSDVEKDVQFTHNTTVWVMYAMDDEDITSSSFPKHSKRSRISSEVQYNLIAMALAADGAGTVFGDCGSSASTAIFSGTCAVASFLFYLISHFVLSS
ncbi:DBH-like monooxygenase protein 1 [Montipora foliosa]|uniref:DBH-like monooxygenase protein 1 n=1 Tax=Montipora foliosa TaxID=591990 RepID=UPI0035F1F329